MKNKMHLGGALGILLIGIGTLTTFISMVNILERGFYREDEFGSILLDLSAENLFFFFLGVSYLLIGGGLMGKAKWSRRAASILCGMSFIGWTYIVIELFRFRNNNNFEFWLEIGLTFTGYALLIFELFFLGNIKVAEEFMEEDKEDLERDILDF